MFSSFSGIRLVISMSPHLHILCTCSQITDILSRSTPSFHHHHNTESLCTLYCVPNSTTATIHMLQTANTSAQSSTLWPARWQPDSSSPQWLKWTCDHCSCSYYYQFIQRRIAQCSVVTLNIHPSSHVTRLVSRRLNDFPAGLWKLRLKSG